MVSIVPDVIIAPPVPRASLGLSPGRVRFTGKIIFCGHVFLFFFSALSFRVRWLAKILAPRRGVNGSLWRLLFAFLGAI